jgi:hypothetical protein
MANKSNKVGGFMQKSRFLSPPFFVAYFAIFNLILYFITHKFWIGGSSFLPMIGILGKNNALLFSGLVNVGVIIGSFIGAKTSGEFIFRMPKGNTLLRGIIGGTLIGAGVTIAPGTCTTSFVIGLPMMSVSSFISGAGIFIGGYIIYVTVLKKR